MADPESGLLVLALAVRAAEAGGAILTERFGGPVSGLAEKSSRADLVSDADRLAEAAIVATIRGERPNDAILGEEGGEVPGRAGIRWVVDPLDGTVNYLWGIPYWAVSIACEDACGMLAAVVLDPVRGERFTAVRGGGAFLGEERLTLASSTDIATALIGTGFSYDAEERVRQGRVIAHALTVLRDVRRNGAAALDLAWVACGRIDGFFESDLAPWDWAAGEFIVREAGGHTRRIPDGEGRPLGLVATRPGLLEPLAALVTV
ncbi:MAG: inositol monophosphatase [Actinobacteria bacterium]|nr:inositol monophosphatase [Actinomycetota bacterium]